LQGQRQRAPAGLHGDIGGDLRPGRAKRLLQRLGRQGAQGVVGRGILGGVGILQSPQIDPGDEGLDRRFDGEDQLGPLLAHVRDGGHHLMRPRRTGGRKADRQRQNG